MDRSDMATWRASRKASVLLSILVTLFVLCLTGCDTLQSADSSPTGATPTPPPSAHHQVTVASTPKAASMAATPAPVAAVQSAEKPIVQKVPEPGQTPHVSVRVAEAKPAPSPARVKGAETLVALSTSQTRSSEAAAGSPKPAQASALNPGDTALSSEPQALFFKGPERPPPRASHKFLWLGLGLGY